MLSNLFWGAPEQEEPEGVTSVSHTTSEEGDWLLISSQNSCGEFWLSCSNCVLVQTPQVPQVFGLAVGSSITELLFEEVLFVSFVCVG